jgi:hypothetical protein
MRPLTPEEARDHLSAASSLTTTSGKAALNGAIPTAVIGVFVGTGTFTYSALASVSALFAAIGLTVLILWLGVLIPWQYRRTCVTPRGWSVRYGASFGLTMVLYAAGIIGWSTSSASSAPAFAAYCVLVALPMVLTAIRMATRTARL